MFGTVSTWTIAGAPVLYSALIAPLLQVSKASWLRQLPTEVGDCNDLVGGKGTIHFGWDHGTTPSPWATYPTYVVRLVDAGRAIRIRVIRSASVFNVQTGVIPPPPYNVRFAKMESGTFLMSSNRAYCTAHTQRDVKRILHDLVPGNAMGVVSDCTKWYFRCMEYHCKWYWRSWCRCDKGD